MLKQLLLLSLLAFLAAGEAQAAPITYTAILNGANEDPPVVTPGTGSTEVIYDPVLRTLRVEFDFAGLIGNTTAAHIHCCTAVPGEGTVGVATQTPTFVGSPLGVTSGSYANTFDLSLPASWNNSFINNNGGSTGTAEAALAAGLVAGKAYLNIHSTFRTGGEIRGFLQVPEPATWSLLGFGLLLIAFRERRISQS